MVASCCESRGHFWLKPFQFKSLLASADGLVSLLFLAKRRLMPRPEDGRQWKSRTA